MRAPIWRVEDDRDPELTGTPEPLVATGRTLWAATRRTWRTWVGAAILGALLGVGALLAAPRQPTATTTLFMVSPSPGSESAMSTDISLLTTRAVAQRVIADLGLHESPETLLGAVTVTPMSDQILMVTVSGPTEDAAVIRLRSLTDNYLTFRADELKAVSAGLVEGYGKRLAALRETVDALTDEYSRVSTARPLDQGRLNEVVTARSTLTTQVIEVQRAVEDATIQTDAAITSTHVLDEPDARPQGIRRRLVIFPLSGAVLGGSIALGTILFGALTTDRLRRRADVACALGVPVRVCVGRVPRPTRTHRFEAAALTWVSDRLGGRPLAWTDQRRQRSIRALVRGLESALGPRFTESAPARHGTPVPAPTTSPRGEPTTLGVAAVDRAHTTAVVVRAVADRLASRGVHVLLVDLSGSGALVERGPAMSSRGVGVSGEAPDGWATPVVFRPDGDPALAVGPRSTRRGRALQPAGPDDLDRLWDEADVVLALVEVDPGIDLDLLGTWVSQLVPLVSAGRANCELLMTVAALAQGAGLEIPFALLEGAEPGDRMIGRAETTLVEPVGSGRVQVR